jgi:hypothetical protein
LDSEGNEVTDDDKINRFDILTKNSKNDWYARRKIFSKKIKNGLVFDKSIKN